MNRIAYDYDSDLKMFIVYNMELFCLLLFPLFFFLVKKHLVLT